MDRLVNVNDVIKMLNNIDRYVSGSLMLESNNKIFPSNEVFIVDDVYEGLETIPSLNGTRKEEFTMTVKELIDALKDYPKDAKVVDDHTGYDDSEPFYKEIEFVTKDNEYVVLKN